jgi:rhamnose utilization protein RhaD (predicted bifunctional aldolase and dehydrogenase)/NAD(P)-dependent dehydrogenase (short-subunit alcohol dehydrogenase family)
MKSRWNDDEVAGEDDLGLCVYASRLLGADPALVLSGGGNSSVKATERDVFGDPVDVLHVKGSGWDMGSIERAGFAPLRLDRVARLAQLDELSDARMANELKAASLDASAPAPSVESILHATLPYRFVLHTHADAVLALTNTPGGEALVGEVYGGDVVTIPYVMPGFVLARLCAERFPAERHAGTVGMVLLHHGLFTFADDARTAYETHIELVGRALDRVDRAFAAGTALSSTAAGAAGGLEGSTASTAGTPVAGGSEWPGASTAGGGAAGRDQEPGRSAAGGGVSGREREPGRSTAGGGAGGGERELVAVAELRRDVSEAAGRPMVVRRATGEASRRFARRADVGTVAQVGPATPDHVLRTKRVPLLGRDVAGYAAAYQAYVDRHRHRLGARDLVPVDPAPRVVVDGELGVLAAGRTPRDARAHVEIAEHTIWVIERAVELGGYASVSEPDVFDVEYWELEQAKLARQPPPRPLTGRIALVTGAASGIGRACARALLDEGAAVVGVDLSDTVDDVGTGSDGPAYAAVQGDVTDPGLVTEMVRRAVGEFGGLDVLVLNAGVFPPSVPVAEMPPGVWDAAMSLNAGAAALALRAAHPYLRLAPGGGRVVVVGSKNVPAPGVGAAAYSASKAALTQLARVAALEWGGDGITVNVIHPDAVFDTGLWDEATIAERAARYGLTPAQYRTRNVLGAEISSADVAALVVALCGPAFARTTGAQIPVDGGNDRVI